MEGPALGGGGATFSEGVQGLAGRDTQCSGLLDKVVFGPKLDEIISEISYNLIDSVILCN